MSSEPIDSFTGPFDFLSNFFALKVVLDGVEYPTLEHAFQAAKTHAAEERAKILNCPTPGSAKRMGKKVKLRPDWENVKLGIMEALVRQKFGDPELKARLLKTRDRVLIEGNHWNDTFWGVCRGKGRNHLGRILMKVRDELKATETQKRAEKI